MRNANLLLMSVKNLYADILHIPLLPTSLHINASNPNAQKSEETKKIGMEKILLAIRLQNAHFGNLAPHQKLQKKETYQTHCTLRFVPSISAINDTIAKLCPPSSLHLLWNSLNLMEEIDTRLPNINHELDKPFTIVELNIAINSTKSGSAPGIDQIDNCVISSLPHEYQIHLLKIYNDILTEGTFPEQWNQSLMVLYP